ncbi:oligosaccharide flippase family protein [soil metagenome]
MQFTKALQHTIVWKVINTVLTFCINLLLVRIMGGEYSGIFFYAIALYAFFTLVMSGSIESGITYFGSNNSLNIKSLSIFLIPWLIIQGGISWLLLGIIDLGLNKQFAWFYIVANLVIVYFTALYYTQKRFILINVIICVVNFFVMIFLLLIYLQPNFFAENPSPLIPQSIGANAHKISLAANTYFAGFVIQALLLLFIFFYKQDWKLLPVKFEPALIKKLFSYSMIAFISNILFFLVTRLDYYFVQKYCDEVALSNYVQVSRMGQLLILLPTMMAAVIFPYSSEKGDDIEANYLQKLQQLCRIISFLFIPVAIIIVATGFWIFPWLFGAAFNQMYVAFLWYLPGFYALSIVTLLAAYLAGKAMLTSNMIATIISLVAVAAGDVFLIPIFGINAAAGVSSLAYIFGLVYLLWVYHNYLQTNISIFFSFKKKDLNLLINIF